MCNAGVPCTPVMWAHQFKNLYLTRSEKEAKWKWEGEKTHTKWITWNVYKSLSNICFRLFKIWGVARWCLLHQKWVQHPQSTYKNWSDVPMHYKKQAIQVKRRSIRKLLLQRKMQIPQLSVFIAVFTDGAWYMTIELIKYGEICIYWRYTHFQIHQQFNSWKKCTIWPTCVCCSINKNTIQKRRVYVRQEVICRWYMPAQKSRCTFWKMCLYPRVNAPVFISASKKLPENITECS